MGRISACALLLGWLGNSVWASAVDFTENLNSLSSGTTPLMGCSVLTARGANGTWTAFVRIVNDCSNSHHSNRSYTFDAIMLRETVPTAVPPTRIILGITRAVGQLSSQGATDVAGSPMKEEATSLVASIISEKTQTNTVPGGALWLPDFAGNKAVCLLPHKRSAIPILWNS